MSVESLPVELVSEICGHLNLQQWSALRLSCRALYENSLQHFAAEYFEEIRFIATSDGLHELEELSKSKGLRERVQLLWMIPTVFEGAEKSMGAVSISSKSCRQVKVGHPELKRRHDVHKEMVADNRSLLESEAFSLRLRRCLDQFENLESIGLAHYTTEFLLDPRQFKVGFLGRRQMMNRINFQFDMYSLRAFTHTQCDSVLRKANSLALSQLLLALAGSKCRPSRLSTCDYEFCGDIGPTLTLTDEQIDSLVASLKNLTSLHLCIDLNEQPVWLKLITKLAPQLEILQLSQDHTPAHLVKSYGDDIFRGIHFARLRRLSIHELDLSFNAFKSLLNSAPKLVDLELKNVKIRSEKQTADDLTSQCIKYLELDYKHPPPPPRPPMRMDSSSPPLETPRRSPYPEWISESSESMTAEALTENSSSIYHPWPPRSHDEDSRVPAGPPASIQNIPPTTACISSVLDLLKNQSLKCLEMEDIFCDRTYYQFKEPNITLKNYAGSYCVEYGAWGGDACSEWISGLETRASDPQYLSSAIEESEGMGEWFNVMIGMMSGSGKWFQTRAICDCKQRPSWGCPFGSADDQI